MSDTESRINESRTTENLKQLVKTFVHNKEVVKRLNKENKDLERMICDIMKEKDLTTFNVDDGTGEITYKIKESLKIG